MRVYILPITRVIELINPLNLILVDYFERDFLVSVIMIVVVCSNVLLKGSLNELL